MIARSWSGMSQPGTRPVYAAFVPRMNSVQSPWLSSIHRPAVFRFTIKLTRGGAVVEISGFSAPDGANGKFIGLGRGSPADTPVLMIVEALPDSKIATYTFRPSGLVA